MISADFAPNESFTDATTSLAMLLKPWRWRKGKALFKVKQKLKKLFGGSYEVFLFLTGRAALYRLFQSLPLEKGVEVAVQAFTCEAVILPLIELGLIPLYIDIERESYSMYPEDLIAKLTPNTKALVLQHTFGMVPKNRERILSIARQRRIIVVEDLAHGFNQQLFNKTNTEPQSQFLLLSFGRTKTLSSVFGGAILSRSKMTNKKLKEFEKITSFPSSYFIFQALWYKPFAWFIRKTYGVGLGKLIHFITNSFQLIPREISPTEKRGEFDTIFIKAYPNALAELLLKQFKQIDQIIQKRLFAIGQYKMYISKDFPYEGNSPLIRFPYHHTNRDVVVSRLKKKKIYLGSWYDQVVGPKELPLDKLKYKSGSCPMAEATCKQILNLPTTIIQKEVDRVIDVFLESA